MNCNPPKSVVRSGRVVGVGVGRQVVVARSTLLAQPMEQATMRKTAEYLIIRTAIMTISLGPVAAQVKQDLELTEPSTPVHFELTIDPAYSVSASPQKKIVRSRTNFVSDFGQTLRLQQPIARGAQFAFSSLPHADQTENLRQRRKRQRSHRDSPRKQDEARVR